MKKNERTIVNVAFNGREQYEKGQHRLYRTWKASGDESLCRLWLGAMPEGSPSHEKVPYAFKWYALKLAAESFRYVMWMDASCVVHRNMELLWDIIEKRGVLVIDNPGTPQNMFAAECVIRQAGHTLEEAKKYHQICGGLVGLDVQHLTGRAVLEEMMEWIKDPQYFRGDGGSSDPEYKGHRHDQACLTEVVNSWEIKREPLKRVCYGWQPEAKDNPVVTWEAIV